MQLSLEPVCVDEVIAETLDLMRPLVQERKITLTADVDLDSTVHVLADAESHPDQPVNAEPDAAVAVSVTVVPLTYGSVQSAPQVIPAGFAVTVPEPRSAFVTVSV